MENKTLSGIIGVLILSIAGNIYQVSIENFPDDATHVCIEEGKITQLEYCDHLSGGQGTRCYKTESSRENWKVCDTGWKEIESIEKKENKKQRIVCISEGCK